ncbi:MAG: hypothetical protein LLG04_11730, partial [Parachlamydia sp.]|nr:hypothetical protein [Parachlamydia sp.]
GIRPIPVPATAQERDVEERPAKKVAFDPNAKEQDGQAAKPAATSSPERGFVTVTTTTYPVFMHAPVMHSPVLPQPVHVLPPPVAMPLPPMPAQRPAPVENREQPAARTFNYERTVHHHEQVRVNQAASPVFIAPALVAAPRPHVVVAQAPVQMPVQMPAPAAKPAQGAYSYERIVNHHEHLRVNQAHGSVIIAPAPAAAPRVQATAQTNVQTTEKRHRYSVMHDWSPVVAFAVTVIFTGFMVSLAVPFAAAAILFPTAVMIAATSLFIKAAMHRRC